MDPLKTTCGTYINFCHPSRQDKSYMIDPGILLGNNVSLGKGTSGNVVSATVKVVQGHDIKEKEYAIKIFQLFSGDDGQKEYTCNLEIHRRVEQNRQQLLDLGIIPGNGIEKKLLSVFTLEKRSCLVKKLYQKNLKLAVQQGVFNDKKLLISASTQLLEGICTLMLIGAMPFDIKLPNILVGRKDKFEIAFTDFERLTFLSSTSEDDKIVRETDIRMPPFLAHEEELMSLMEIKLKENPAKEFVARLHKLYSFVLGAAFFEMATQMSLMKFMFLKSFVFFLEANMASPNEIEEFWKNGCGVDEKKLCSLSNGLNEKYTQAYLFYSMGVPKYPDLEFLRTDSMQKAIVDYLYRLEAPKGYPELVASMLNADGESRIDILTALKTIRLVQA